MEQNHVELWHKCLNIIKDNIGNELFSAWFGPSSSKGYEDGVVTITLPSVFYSEQYESRFYHILRAAMSKVYGAGVKLRYEVDIVKGDSASNMVFESQHQSKVISGKTAQHGQKAPNPFETATYEDVDSQLNPTYNFENYCVGESNKLPFTIAQFIANNPGKIDFNPFFLYGSVGVGKTHLIQAIGIRIKEQNPSARVLYTTSRIFENQFAKANIEKRVPDFINFYQSIDVLLIDDLQEMYLKKGNQDALFSIFNYLHQRGKILILTSDRPPMELEGIMDRLIDRFKWGVTEMLPKPDLALRKKILMSKAAKNGLDIPMEVIDMIAENITGSVRELEGMVMSIITRSIAMSAPITVDLARIVMQQSFKQKKAPLNFEMILEATADYFHINPDVIFTNSRVRDVAESRQIVMYLTNKHTDLSSPAIGYKMNRKHSTVLYGIKTIGNRLSLDKSLADAIDAIEESLQR